MDKVLAIAGGQPLRSNDLQSIQAIYTSAFRGILEGLSGTRNCLVSGLQVSLSGSTITVTAGIFWDGTELSYVAGATFAENELKLLYLQQVISLSDNRVFHDLTNHDIYETRRYILKYELSIPSGQSFLLGAIQSLIHLIQQRTGYMIYTENYLNLVGSASFPGWATPETASTIQINKNLLGMVQIISAFHSTVDAGMLFTLPATMRPLGDIVQCFYAGETLTGVCMIKSSGQVWLRYISTTGVNYINITFQTLSADDVEYDVPTSGWTMQQ